MGLEREGGQRRKITVEINIIKINMYKNAIMKPIIFILNINFKNK